MKCPSCGAEIGANKKCEYCGAAITVEMQKEQEQLNKAGCPKCGSSNIEFKRENQGEIRGKKSKKIVHATVGYCKDCGFTWYPQGEMPKKNRTWLWVLGWIFIFPVPLTILLWRKKDMKPAVKYGIIAAAWCVYLLIGLFGGGSDSTNSTDAVVTTETSVEKNDVVTTEESHIYDNAEVVDIMSGDGSKKIGTITVTHAKQIECTEEALVDWFTNYVQNHTDSNYHIIVYDDIKNKGVYSLGESFIQKDVEINKDSSGSYSIGDDAGSTYYSISEDGTMTVQTVMADSSVVDDVKKKVDAVVPEEYKSGKHYAVDVSGEEGKLDCCITIVNDEFEGADFQSIAEALATQVKELDLGIGYFNVCFEKEDYSVKALASVDNLGAQEVSEIVTTVY